MPPYSLLTPTNHALLLIDHQQALLEGVRSHAAGDVVNHAVLLAKVAGLFEIPRLATVMHATEPRLAIGLEEAGFAAPLVRIPINPWEEAAVVQWARETDRQKLVMAGLRTEDGLALGVLSALEQGYEVFVVADACGGDTPEAHAMAMERLIQAGAAPITAWSYVTELQQRGDRRDLAEATAALLAAHERPGEAHGWRLQAAPPRQAGS